MNWFILSLSATFLFSIYGILSKILSLKSKYPNAFSAIYYLLTALISLIFIFFQPSKIFLHTLSTNTIILTILSFIIWGIFGKVEFLSRKKVEASILPIIVKIAPIVTFLISMIFFKEKITIGKAIALILILIANILVLGNKLKAKFDKNLIYAVILGISLGAGWAIDSVVSVNYALPFYTAFTFFASSISNLFFPPLKKEILIEEYKITNLLFLIILAFVNAAGYFLMVKAYSYGVASNIAMLISASDVITIIFAIIILKERSNILKKVIAGIMITIAVLLLK